MNYKYEPYPMMLYRVKEVSKTGDIIQEQVTVYSAEDERLHRKRGWTSLQDLKIPKFQVWLLKELKPFFEKWGWLFQYFGGLITGIILMIIKDFLFVR